MAEPAETINGTRDLGYMLYDMNFVQDINDPQPMFFRARIENGAINTDRREVEVRG